MMIREEPLYQKSIASADGSKLLTFARPEFAKPQEIYIDKIALSMNQEQHFALFEAYFIDGSLVTTRIGKKRLSGTTLRDSFLFRPPILWDLLEDLKIYVIINSGTATVVEMKVYWSRKP